MRKAVLAVVLMILAAGCGGGDASTSEASQFPTGSVRLWFDALETGDTLTALDLTYQKSMLVIIAAENTVDPAEIAALLRRGVTEESAAGYLADFAASLRSRYGKNLADITVDGFTQLNDTYAAVDVTGDGGATIITRRAPGGLWQIDMVGTIGPALVTQIRQLLEFADDGDDGATIRETYGADVVPALEAAVADDPENLALASEIRVMKSLLNSGS